MSNSEWTPRIATVVTEEQFLAIQQAVPWGMRNRLFQAFADELVRISNEHGHVALVLLHTKGFNVVLKED